MSCAFLTIPILSHFQWLFSHGYFVKVTPKKGKATNLKATITVKNPALSVKAAKEVAVGATEQITATVKPANTKVTYTSSDKEIATVDAKGVVTGVKAGDVTITVKAGKTTKTVKMTVVAALSAKQTGAKKVTVTSNTDLKDAKITVKKGNNVVNATAEVNGKEAVLTLSANIVADKYTVTVDDKDTTFDGEASKISSIEVGDIAIADQALPIATGATGTAKVAYRVLNQFGEDLSKTTTLNVTSSMTTAPTVSGGTVTLTLPALTKEGDIATVVLIEKNTGVNASKTVKVSAEAAVSEVALGEIYNKDGKELTEGIVAANTFYLVVDLKDQYGNAVTNPTAAASQILITNAAGLTGVDFDTLTTLKIGTEDKLVLPVKSGTLASGTGTILVIAKNTGKNAQTTYKVVDGVKVDSFSASPKDIVVGGSPTEFDFSATDTYGKEIADPTAAMFNTVPAGFAFVKDATTGKTVLKYTASDYANDTPVIANFITKTNKVVTVSFTVKKNAYPVAISKIKDFTAGVLNNGTKTINVADVIFEDQYGREMKAADALDSINGVTYSLEVKAPATYASGTTAEVDSQSLAANATVAATAKLEVKPTANSSNTFQFILKAGSDVKDTKDVTVVSKNLDDLTSFAVKDIALVNGNVSEAVATALTVTGTADDGTVVDVPATQYTVYGQLATNAGTASTISGKNLYTADEKVSEKEGSFDVVIKNAKGTTISKTVKVSNEAAKVATVKLADSNVMTVATTTLATNPELLSFITAKDQYGADITVDASHNTPRITIKNVDGTTLIATGNGTTTTAISKAPAFGYVEISYVFTSGVKFDTSATLSK